MQAEIQRLGVALDCLAKGADFTKLQDVSRHAQSLHLRSEREGLSEVATALWHVGQVLEAVRHGELVAKDGVWRQATAACRAALVACEIADKENDWTGTFRTTRALAVGGGAACLGRLTEAARRKRVELVNSPDVVSAIVALAERDFDVLVYIDSCGGRLRHDLPLVARGIGGRLPIAVLGLTDEFAIRLCAARAGAQLYLRQDEPPDTVISALTSLAACSKGEPARVLTMLGDGGEGVLDALNHAGIAAEAVETPGLLLQTLSRYRPDVLLIDWTFSGLPATELCRVLRAEPSWKWLKVMVRVPTRTSETLATALESGADQLVDASLPEFELIALIKSGVMRSRSFQEDSSRDLLTSLLTRRAFMDAISGRLAEALRCKKLVSICLIDVDHFKQVNDTHGHSVGDRVLASLGNVLTSRLRTEDLRGRWGGEEFVVAFYGEWALSAREILLRITSEFAKLEHSGGDGSKFHVTVSAGIATYPLDGGTFDELIVAADRRLYAAKHEGRNRIKV